jgi:exonuclease SbcC
VQAILSKIWDVELEKAKQTVCRWFKVAENSVADSEKLLMNQTFDIKVFEDLVEECKLTYEAQLSLHFAR